MNKRFAKEINNLIIQQNSKPLLDNDYLIEWDETDINTVHAIIKPPTNSVYRHKFIRLDIQITDDYPLSPPQVRFVNHDSVRIHPNMYQDGKCCSTILNTWGDDKFEKWTASMGIETILLTFHSFLDNNPYTYEPGGGDNPSYTVYVLYQSWITCLLRYMEYETVPSFLEFIQTYLTANIGSVFDDLTTLSETYPYGTYYTPCFEIDHYVINYTQVQSTLAYYYDRYFEKLPEYTEISESDDNSDDNYIPDYTLHPEQCNYTCNICFDTRDDDTQLTVLTCHSFHTTCLNEHMETNGKLCPMCRREIYVAPEWMINPLTKRRIKIGGRTYNYLRETGAI